MNSRSGTSDTNRNSLVKDMTSPISSNNSQDSYVMEVTKLLGQKLQNATKQSHNPCVYEIPKNLRSCSPQSYTPFRVAIGPYHGNYSKYPGLEPMQQYKELYFSTLISRNRSLKLDDYVAEIPIQDLQTARKYYAKIDEKFESNKMFLAMLLTDSAFIVEFICRVIESELFNNKHSAAGKSTITFRAFFTKARHDQHKDETDPIARNLRTYYAVCRDMILLENQVPYFIVLKVFNLTFGTQAGNDPTLAEIAYHVLKILVPFKSSDFLGRDEVRKRSSGEVKHLVHLMWLCCLPFPEQSKGLTETPSTTPGRNNFFSKYFGIKGGKLRLLCIQIMIKYFLRSKTDENEHLITATQLQEAGVRFKVTKKPANVNALLANLSFSNGVLKLPCLTLDDTTEMFFRNVIAFEQYYLNKFHITNYMYFLDSLIDTPKDVQILEECNVIENMLESKDTATSVFNNMGRYTTSDGHDFRTISKRIKSHAARPWNRWKAMLRRDYFATPWAVISFFAALVLLGLTIVQTIASVRSVTW